MARWGERATGEERVTLTRGLTIVREAVAHVQRVGKVMFDVGHSLQPSTPAVLPGDPHRPEIVVDPIIDAGAAVEFDRLIAAHGEGCGQAETHIRRLPPLLTSVDAR